MNVNPLEQSIGQTSGKPNSTRAEWINQLSELQEVRAYRPAREQARLCWRPLLERVTVKKGAESRVIASGLKGRHLGSIADQLLKKGRSSLMR